MRKLSVLQEWRETNDEWRREQEELRSARHALPGVYFIAAGDEMKIGHSADPLARISQLQVGCPQKLKLIHVVHEPDLQRREDLEGWLHEMFAPQHLRAEWFTFAIPYNYAYQVCSEDCAPRLRPRPGRDRAGSRGGRRDL